MAGGIDTPLLVSTVGERGGIGFIGAAYLSPDRLSSAVAEVRSLTERPFGVNLFGPVFRPGLPADIGRAIAAVTPAYASLGLQDPTGPGVPDDLFDARLEVALNSGATALSFILSPPTDTAVDETRRRGMTLIGTATTVAEGRHLEELGVDAVVAQGAEAGGHRGTFAADVSLSLVGTMALVPQMVDALEIPVIAAGGIMDGRGIAAALALGAQAVQMGTVFLATEESGADATYTRSVLAAADGDPVVTTVFTGKPARAIRNRFIVEIEDAGEAAVLPFPYQGELTGPIRSAAKRQHQAGYQAHWAGQGVGMARSLSTRDLMSRLVEETDEAIRRLSGR